jgi:hypothetical protein
MVTGYNPYAGIRFLEYYNRPERYNPGNRFDPNYALPSGQLNDFYGWAFALSFDSNDNLYVFDTNRGRVLIYKQPFATLSPILAQVTPVPNSTFDNTPNYTFSSTKSGTITYSGGCSSSVTNAVVGNNTITFNTLSVGTYSNCTIKVIDSGNNVSKVLNIPSFTVVSSKIKGDFNNDKVVNLSDLSILATYWNQNSNVADANNDNVVNISDLSILAQNWMQSF